MILAKGIFDTWGCCYYRSDSLDIMCSPFCLWLQTVLYLLALLLPFLSLLSLLRLCK